jgi:hypothetical protein
VAESGEGVFYALFWGDDGVESGEAPGSQAVFGGSGDWEPSLRETIV